MTTNYPGAIDTLDNNKLNDTLEIDDHPQVHNNIADAIMAMETELGANPSGSAATVKTRLDGLDTTIAGISVGATYPLDVRTYGASVGNVDNRSAIQAALADGDIVIPNSGGNPFKIKHATSGDTTTSLYVPARREILLPSGGAIQQVDACQQMIRFGGNSTSTQQGGKGNQGGIKGGGQLLANRFAQRCVLVDSWHGAKFMDFEVCDQIYAGIHIKANVFGTGDSDGHHIHHVIHRHDSSCSATSAERPKRFIVIEGGGGAGEGSSDNVIDGNCYVADGLLGETVYGSGDGGWGIEVINSSRVQIANFGCFDNTRFYSGAVLFRLTSALVSANAQQHGNVVDTMYTEAQASSPPANWIHSAVTVQVDAGSTKASLMHSIERLRYATTAGQNGKRLRAINNVAGNPADRITKLQYMSPRNDLTQNGHIQLDAGVTNCVIQTMGPQTGFVKQLDNTTAVDSSNKLVNLLA